MRATCPNMFSCMLLLHSKQWKNSALHYRYPYTASSGITVYCITDTFALQAVEEQCAALPIPLHCKQWKSSVLHYRYLYTASSGRAVCCITDTFTLQAVEEQCAASLSKTNCKPFVSFRKEVTVSNTRVSSFSRTDSCCPLRRCTRSLLCMSIAVSVTSYHAHCVTSYHAHWPLKRIVNSYLISGPTPIVS
jgi:hypothetical protein